MILNTEKLTHFLSSAVHLESLLLHGSYARGDASIDSDIDLIVISDAKVYASDLNFKLEEHFKQHFSVTVLNKVTFFNLWEKGVLFLYFSLKEGRVLYDRNFITGIKVENFPFKNNYRIDVQIEIKKTDIYRDYSKYNGCYRYPTGKIYTCFKRISILKLAQDGIFISGKHQAIKQYYSKFFSDDDVKLILSAERYTKNDFIGSGELEELQRLFDLLNLYRREYVE